MAARSKEWDCGRSLAGIAGSNPSGTWMFVSCECYMCQVEVSVMRRSLFRADLPNGVCATKCDREASTITD